MEGTLHETPYNETDGNLIFIPNYSLTHAVMQRFNICELEPNCVTCCCKPALDGTGQELYRPWQRTPISSHGKVLACTPSNLLRATRMENGILKYQTIPKLEVNLDILHVGSSKCSGPYWQSRACLSHHRTASYRESLCYLTVSVGLDLGKWSIGTLGSLAIGSLVGLTFNYVEKHWKCNRSLVVQK